MRLIFLAKKVELLFVFLGWFFLCSSILCFFFLVTKNFMDGSHVLNAHFFLSFPSRFSAKAGILSAWVGTFLVMIVTMITSVPLGVAAAAYLEEYAHYNWLSEVIEVNLMTLAAMPAILYGLAALTIFVRFLGFDHSILSAGLTLGLLVLPIIIVTTRESMRACPVSIKEGAYGLGATKFCVVKDHVLLYASPGILTGIVVGLTRAIGEAAPLVAIGALTFVAFLPPAPFQTVFPYLSFDWLFSEFTVMPIQIFNWVSRPDKAFQGNAAAASFVLLWMTLSMNLLAIFFRYRLRTRYTLL